MEGIVKKNKESPFVVHSEERHGRTSLEDYEMKITGVYGGDATKLHQHPRRPGEYPDQR